MRRALLLSAVLLVLTGGAIRAAGASPADVPACPACDDGDPCTVDTCIEVTQTCRHDPVSCDDGNPCTVDYCLVAAGGGYACRSDQALDGTSCDDGRSCTTDDACRGGACAGTPVAAGPCDDGNPCTEEDVCSAGVCKGLALSSGTPCDDRNPCTVDDACTADAVCAGRALLEGDACDDGNRCTSGDQCASSPEGIACTGHPTCDDGDACTQDACDPGTGACTHAAVSCDDGNPCTADTCDSEVGRCRHADLSVPCNDGQSCTDNDACQNGRCTGQPRNSGPCDDGNFCTTGDTCVNGVCQGGARVTCGSGCMEGICDPEYGCGALNPNPSLCGSPGQCYVWLCDNGQCRQAGTTGERCDPGFTTQDCQVWTCLRTICEPGPISQYCDDHNPCTVDSCPNNQSCAHTPVADGTACRLNACAGQAGACVAGQCTGEGPIDCDDHDPCTDDTCQPSGCQHAPKTCDDGNACTIDRCQAGDGSCTHLPTPDATPCDDGNTCTRADRCVQGACQPGPTACDDFDACTVDTCGPDGACEYRPIDCTVDNPCVLGYCIGGCLQLPRTGLPCDDEAHCVVGGICDLDANQTPYCRPTHPDGCEDGDPCTVGTVVAPGCTCVQTPTALPTTCGVGACARTMDACESGTFHDCVPGTPQVEQACNGLDDDCDGATDENDLAAVCSVRPRIMRDGGLMRGFTVMCRLRDRCAQLALLSPLEGVIDPAWVSAADLAGDVTDDVAFPDPATLACTEPHAGPERGIQEDVAARLMDADSVTFAFDRPADGVCSTLDGGRRDLAALLADLPDGALARVCVASRYAGRPFEGCGIVRVRH